MKSCTNGMMNQNGWISLITSFNIDIFVLITLLLFKNKIFRYRNLYEIKSVQLSSLKPILIKRRK